MKDQRIGPIQYLIDPKAKKKGCQNDGFFFLTCPRKGRRRGIRTCDLRFIRRGSQSIELSLRNKMMVFEAVQRELGCHCM
jgi:hypothetical protein